MTTSDDPGAPDLRTRPRSPFGDPADEGSARVERALSLAARPGGLSSLNRLAELAARLLGVESGQVSVIADEQTVMGGSGLASASVGLRSPGAESLCSVPVAAGVPVPIADTRTDVRVRTLPPVAAGVVGAYLGVPLRSGDHVIGALCVFGGLPREWSAEDVALLEQLAGPAIAELELAALETSYEEDRAVWQLAVDAAGVGAFDWDLGSGMLRWDERLIDLFGLSRETFGGTIEAFNESVHPDDRARVGAALDDAIACCGEYAAEYRVVRPDGAVRWVAARGHAVPGADGAAVKVVGAAYDTTAVREGEARVARTLDVMPTAFYHLDPDWRFTYANPEAQRLLGAVSSAVEGHVVWDLFPATVGNDFERNYRGAVASDEPRAFEAYYPPPLDAWFEIRCWPTPDGLSVYFIDVTERRKAQDVLQEAARRAEMIAAVADALTDTLEEDEAVDRLTKILVPGMADWCVITLVDGTLPADPLSDPGWRKRLRDIGWWHTEPEARPLVERYAEVRVPSLTDDSLVLRALATGEPVVVLDDAVERLTAVLRPGPAADTCRLLAPTAAAVMPLRGRGRISGLMSVFRGAGRPAFGDDDLQLLGEIADRAGLALDNVSRYTNQRDLAEGLQRSLLTAAPRAEGLEVAVRYEPAAESAQVGGDWYDAFLQPDGALTLVIGDVIGHDTVAAAAMGQVRTLLRGIAVTTDEGPAAVLHRVDQAMEILQVDTIATGVVARLEPASEEETATAGSLRLRWSNAGHPPPVVALPGATATEVTTRLLWAEGANSMLGLLADPTRSSQRDESVVVLPPGATLLLYTDGLVERRGELLDVGLERLRSALTDLAAADLGLDELCDRLLRELLPTWTEDDVALVAVRIAAPGAPA